MGEKWFWRYLKRSHWDYIASPSKGTGNGTGSGGEKKNETRNFFTSTNRQKKKALGPNELGKKGEKNGEKGPGGRDDQNNYPWGVKDNKQEPEKDLQTHVAEKLDYLLDWRRTP